MIETGLPANRSDGDTILLRLGSSPYEYLMLTYDDDYERWVGQPMPVSGNAAEAAVSTTGTIHVPGPTLKLPNYNLFFAAGLRLQARLTGTYSNDNSAGKATLSVNLVSGVVDEDSGTERGVTPGKTSPGGTTAALNADSGWQDFSSDNPITDNIGQLAMRLVRTISGTASVTDRQLWLRWIADPFQHINVFVAM